jgi:hypothetical protein
MTMILNVVPEWSQAHAVVDIADLVRHEGHRVYNTSVVADGCYQSMLCGLTVCFKTGGDVVSMKSHDMHIVIQLHEVACEQDDGIDRRGHFKKLVLVDYMKGNAATLAAWHRHLSAYRQSIRGVLRETVFG